MSEVEDLLKELEATRALLLQKEQDAQLAAELGSQLLADNSRIQSEFQEIVDNKDVIIKELTKQLDDNIRESQLKPLKNDKDELITELRKDNTRLQARDLSEYFRNNTS